jgi:protein-S-isoprenylcysteine O-methyltransferase Ste14
MYLKNIMLQRGYEMSHHEHENLAGEHRLTDIGQAVIFIVFIGVWIPDFFLGYSNFINQYIPLEVKLPVGIILLILSGFMARTGLSIVFGKDSQTDGVIRKGVFNFVRHPIYLSEIILYLGLLMINLSLAATGVWIAGIIFLHYVSRHEEQLLLSKYGKQYQEYMKEVPMWFPRLLR